MQTQPNFIQLENVGITTGTHSLSNLQVQTLALVLCTEVPSSYLPASCLAFPCDLYKESCHGDAKLQLL